MARFGQVCQGERCVCVLYFVLLGVPVGEMLTECGRVHGRLSCNLLN